MADKTSKETIDDLEMPKGENPDRWERWIAHLKRARDGRPDLKDVSGVSARDVFDLQLNGGPASTKDSAPFKRQFDTIPSDFK